MSAATDPEITKDFLAAQLAQLELRLAERVMASERSLRTALDSKVDSLRNMVFGTYALILAAIFINHFWK
jgi:hypothetical protein